LIGNLPVDDEWSEFYGNIATTTVEKDLRKEFKET
jgi:hypothetical protein